MTGWTPPRRCGTLGGMENPDVEVPASQLGLRRPAGVKWYDSEWVTVLLIVSVIAGLVLAAAVA